jgi:ribosomal protein S16
MVLTYFQTLLMSTLGTWSPCRGREEDWIKIQANTFKNWINVNLRETGLTVEDLSTDFSDGVR